jgi:Protein of unknown function (DUF3891)
VIVSRRSGRLLLVRQVDHQDQCGLMAAAWGNERFARPEPFAPIALAAAIHDEGWRAWERRPEVDAGGAPVNFSDIDRPTHVALYREGIATAARRDPRAGLLVSLHGQGLYEGRRGLDRGRPTPRARREPAVREFLAEQDGVQRALRELIGPGAELDEWAWAGYRLLQTWDVISLFLTWSALGDRGGISLPQVPDRPAGPGVELRLEARAGGEVTCAPWPFSGDVVDLPVAARAIPDRPYASAAELAEALSTAGWESLDRRLSRPRT